MYICTVIKQETLNKLKKNLVKFIKSMKTIILDGRVGTKGTEVKSTKAGKPYAHFSIANNTFSNGEEKTEWYDVISYESLVV